MLIFYKLIIFAVFTIFLIALYGAAVEIINLKMPSFPFMKMVGGVVGFQILVVYFGSKQTNSISHLAQVSFVSLFTFSLPSLSLYMLSKFLVKTNDADAATLLQLGALKLVTMFIIPACITGYVYWRLRWIPTTIDSPSPGQFKNSEKLQPTTPGFNQDRPKTSPSAVDLFVQKGESGTSIAVEKENTASKVGTTQISKQSVSTHRMNAQLSVLGNRLAKEKRKVDLTNPGGMALKYRSGIRDYIEGLRTSSASLRAKEILSLDPDIDLNELESKVDEYIAKNLSPFQSQDLNDAFIQLSNHSEVAQATLVNLIDIIGEDVDSNLLVLDIATWVDAVKLHINDADDGTSTVVDETGSTVYMSTNRNGAVQYVARVVLEKNS
jgi:hypothetical protein